MAVRQCISMHEAAAFSDGPNHLVSLDWGDFIYFFHHIQA